MKKVYVAASFAYTSPEKTAARKADIERIVDLVKTAAPSFDFYLPHQLKIPNAWSMTLEQWSEKVFMADLAALQSADIVLFISYGKENNSGSVWECGYAFAIDRPVITISMAPRSPESLMITSSATAILKEKDISTYDWVALPYIKATLSKISQ